MMEISARRSGDLLLAKQTAFEEHRYGMEEYSMDSTMFGPAYRGCAALYMEHHGNSAYNKFKSWWGINVTYAISKEGKKRKRNGDTKILY